MKAPASDRDHPRGRGRAARTAATAFALAAAVLPDSGAQAPSPDRTPAPAGAGPVSLQGAPDFASGREAIFDAFYRTGIDASAAYAVADLELRRDSATLLLRRGTVLLLRPIAGETTGAVFLGEGELAVTPPNRTERYMIRKYTGGDVLRQPFTEAVLRFSDGTDLEIRDAAPPRPVTPDEAARAAEILRDRSATQDDTRELTLEMQFLETRIAGLLDQGFFLVEMRSGSGDWFVYRHNPQEISEHAFSRSESLGSTGRRYLHVLSDWHDQAEYAPSGHYRLLPDRDGPRNLAIRHVEMTLDLRGTKTVAWRASLEIEPLAPGLRCLRFDLANNAHGPSRWHDDFLPVRTTAVTDAGGAALPFLHRKDQLLVLLPEPAAAGSRLTVGVAGTADVVYQLTAESFGLSQAAWYPQYGFLGGRSTFRWTVRVPKRYLVTGSGTFRSESEDAATGQNVLETGSDRPVFFPWIIFGRFKRSESAYTDEASGRTVPLTLHSFPYMTYSITDPGVLERFNLTGPVTITLTAPARKIDDLFEEGRQILRLHEALYGPYPYDQLHIAQMAPFLGYGQAPQGFVQMTGEAFMSQARISSDFFHGFFAHEIAHQWWGHQIAWGTPDDEWLSEAFAEYAAGIFVREYQGAGRFQRTLEEWRRSARLSDAEAPIAAANTLYGRGRGRHRGALLYAKGPYVLHMLRVQLGDEMYVKVMRRLHEVYRERNISTEMIIAEINRLTGADHRAFFDQWFYDVGIPTFRYRWRSDRRPDGGFLVTVHVAQDDRARVKKVLMPVHLHFKGRTVPHYKWVAAADEAIEIVSEQEPKDVTLDDDRTLLAEIVRAS